jgi:hypothetical protein
MFSKPMILIMILITGTKRGGTYQYLTFEQMLPLRFFNITDDDGNNVARFEPDPNEIYIDKMDVDDGNTTPIYKPQLQDDVTPEQDEPSNCRSRTNSIITLATFILYQLRGSII